MIIRNLPYKELNEIERRIVKAFYVERLLDDDECSLDKDVDGFWEVHRETDTENGKYDGWNDEISKEVL